MSEYLVMAASRERTLMIDNFFKGLDLSRDESVCEADVAGLSYNFDFSSGALVDGWGVEGFDIPCEGGIAAFWRFYRGAEQILMFCDQGGSIYYVDQQGNVGNLGAQQVSGRVYAVNYRLYGEDVIIICSEGGDMIVWNGINTPYRVANAPKVASMAVHDERLLVIDFDKNRLRYSMDLDPTNWNATTGEGGCIDFSADKGRLNRVVSFLNYAYVFRDYGISRISFSTSTPVVTDLFTSGGKIYADTAAIVGDKIIFLCSDGLYQFDGLDTKRILGNLKGAFLPSTAACAVCHNGAYYLALRLNLDRFNSEAVGCEEGNYVNNGLLVYDNNNGDYCICRGLDINSFAEFNDELLVLCGQRSGKMVKRSEYFGEPLARRWRSVFCDLGTKKTKILRSVELECDGEAVLVVNADGVERGFDIGGDNTKIRVNMRGKKISFCFIATKGGVRISRPVLVLSQ